MKEKRLDLYLIRIIACLMVLMTHVSANPMVAGVFPHSFYKLVNASSKFCVPLFIFLSGFLLERNYEEGMYKKYYIKVLKRLILPYLSWLFAYYMYFILSGIYRFDWKQLLIGVLTGNIVFHLYYMLISVQLYLLYPLIRKIRGATGYLPLLFIAVLGALYSGKIPYLQNYTHILLSTYLLYAVIGMLLFANESKVNLLFGVKGAALFGALMYLGSVALFYVSYSPSFITYREMYILGSVIGILGIYFLARAADPLRDKLGKFVFYRIEHIADSTDIVYYTHVYVMLFVSGTIRSGSALLLFTVQLTGIVALWAVLSFLPRKRRV